MALGIPGVHLGARVIFPLRLSRRDRRVYECALSAARVYVANVDQCTRDPLIDVHAVITVHINGERLYLDTRVERVRWALLLRAVLRADAYEREAVELGVPASILMRWHPVCDGCGEPVPNYAIGDPVNICPKRGGHPVARQARPLWEHAPKTRAR